MTNVSNTTNTAKRNSNNDVTVIFAIAAIMVTVPLVSMLLVVANIAGNFQAQTPPSILQPIPYIEEPVESLGAIPMGEASEVIGDNARINIDNALASLVPDYRLGEVTLIAEGGLYEVNVNGNPLYFSGDGKVMVEGNAFGTRDGRRYTQNFIDEHTVSEAKEPAPADAGRDVPDADLSLNIVDEQPVSAASNTPQTEYQRFPDTLAIMTGDVGAPLQVAVFTDPDCPFCRQLEQRSSELEGVEIANLLYPIEEIHPGATMIADKIWCSPEPAVAFKEYMTGDGDRTHLDEVEAGCSAPIDMIAKAAKRAGVRGTPTFLSVDGRVLEGYPGRDEFLKWVKNER